MKEELECPLCNEKIYSELGKGCKMCGMSISEDENFCSETCETRYKEINDK